MYKAKELRDQSLEELQATYDDSCKKLFNLVSQFKSDKKVESRHQIKHTRKDIARILTIITEKKCYN